MASIMTAIELQDRFSSVLYGVIDTVNIAISSMYDMSEAMNTGIDTSALQAAQDRIVQTTAALDRMNAAMEEPSGSLPIGQEMEEVHQQINNNIEAQNRFNDTIADCHSKVVQVDSGFKEWEKAIVVANNALGLVKNVLGDAGVMDMSGAFGRIDTMNRFQKTITTMTGDAGLAEAALAKLKDVTVGTAYGLDVASKATQGFITRGMSLGAATEQIRIWADAVSFYGEGTNEQLESVVDAIGKMYSKGTVEADQLSRLFDAGIGAAEIYANAVGESVSQVQDDLSDGTISAAQFLTVVSQAMDAGVSSGAAKTAGDTWATTFANVGAAINRGWVEIIENLDAALASRGLPSTMEMVQMFGQTVENTLDTVAWYMGMVVDLAMNIGNAMTEAGSFVSDNWGVIAPIIYGVVAALAAYALIAGVVAVINGVSAAAQAVHNAQTAMATGATFAYTASQYGLNAALLACPLTWIILLISALVVVIVLVCAHIAKMGGTAQTAFGVFCGAVNVGLQYFKNFGLAIADVVLAIWNSITAIAGNIPIAFHNALAEAKSYFYGFEYVVVSIIAAIGDALNKLPFVSFDTSGLWSAANGYAAKAMQAANSKQEYNSISDAWNEGKNTFEVFQDGWVQEAYNKGANWGDGISDKVSDKISGLKDFFNPSDGLPDKDDHQKDYSSILGDSSLGNIAGNTGDIAGNTGSLDDIAGNTGNTAEDTARIADAVDITDDDLKYLRDIAERDIIDRTVFTKVEVNMGGVTNQVNNMSDLDDIADRLNGVLQEQIMISAEG
jgi:tape measure domain-containing protein|nr:MAG TPA: tail tape measure [Caudoviricetes sp.]